MGVRAAERVTPQHPRRVEVARVGELAGRLRDRVGALDALADTPALERRFHCAASRTASMILE